MEKWEQIGEDVFDVFLNERVGTLVKEAIVRYRQPLWTYSSTKDRKIIIFFLWRALRRALYGWMHTLCIGIF